MAVGELFLGAFLNVLFDKLADGLVLAFAKRERIYKLLIKWNDSLKLLLAVISDAEEKQLTDKHVKLWLENLRDLAYTLDDVLDEITTQAFIQKMQEGGLERKGKIGKFINMCKDWTPDAIMFKKRMKSKIKEISNMLEHIATQANALRLNPTVGGSSSIYRTPSTSVIDSRVYGRDKDKEAVTKLVVSNREEVSVIPIVGMGGVGKTTLAQLIYNDNIMTESFDLKIWVCVSEEFDVFTVTKTIYHAVTGASTESKDLNMLQVGLQQALTSKKFLLVLDDVWNEDYAKWKQLTCAFGVGLPGSKVLVTTRSARIAKMVGSGDSYRVNVLDDCDCLSLLAQHALGKENFDEHPDLKEIGIALVKKCRGLPLAAKTLGGLLRSEETVSEWEDVLHSKIWDLPKENDILPVLRLSYNHLPPHLKHLFAYCSIFPKDYEFDKCELVLLWMGEGFLGEPEGRKTKEQLGFEYFNELLSRSFFQLISSDSSHFVMHDLINDLAQFVAGEICYKLDEKVETNEEYKIPKKARHASFLRHEYEVFKKFMGFHQVEGLRTFIPMPVQNVHVWPPFYLSHRILIELLPNLHNLRVLSLSGYSITEIPDLICALIHVRYLNLSGTAIVSLPESLSKLYNLETLSIRNCRFICNLPPTMEDLVNLRHLDNSNTDQLKELPVEIGKLRNLQTLPKIVLSKSGGKLGLKELRNLEFLRGSVALLELQNVMITEDAKEACMRSKTELEELHLAWANDMDGSRNAHREESVLDELQPHTNLGTLKIDFYGGVRFPNWVGNPAFKKLSTVSLNGFPNCTSLPPLGQLPELKHLWIEDMPKIKYIGAGFCPFPKLETLRFARMPAWVKWAFPSGESQMQFPCLKKLTIFKCPKLTEISTLSLPVLHNLDVEQCNAAVLESFRDLGSLGYLKVEYLTGISHLPREVVCSMENLEVLECCNCNDLISVWPIACTLQHLTRLRRLVVADCSLLSCLGELGQELPPKLEILELFRCASLISLPNDLSNLKCLTELILKNCPKIVRFPEQGIPPVLKRLEILGCKDLASLPINTSKLERLEIKECPSLKKWEVDLFPRSLKKLSIKNCDELEPVAEVMFPPNRRIILEDLSIWDWKNFSTLLKQVHNFSFLAELTLSHCEGLDRFPEQGLPPHLKTLSVEHCSGLRSFPNQMRNMTSLISLEIRSCRKLKSFPKCDFPPNLSSLRIWDSRKLKHLSEWGLHRLSFLREFSLCGGFQELELLGDDNRLFPSSLVKLSFARFPKLSSLATVLENLSSLHHLSIMNCTNLTVLPSENFLERLWHLEISDCPALKQRCLKDKGEYWPKIAGIPCVVIDGTYIYRQS